MKKLFFTLLVVLYSLVPVPAYALLLEKLKEQQKEALTLATSREELSREKLRQLKLEKQKSDEDIAKDAVSQQEALLRVADQLKKIKEQQERSRAEDSAYCDRSLGLLNEIQQTIFTIQLLQKQISTTLEQHIQALEDYLKDTTLHNHTLELHAFYRLDDLQRETTRIHDQEVLLASLKDQKADMAVQFANRKKKLEVVTKLLSDKLSKQEAFGLDQKGVTEWIEFSRKGKILDLEQELLGYEKKAADLALLDAKLKSGFLETAIFIEGEKLNIIKANLNRVKQALRIEQDDIQLAKEELEKEKKESFERRNVHYETIKNLDLQKEKTTERYNQAIGRYDISAGDYQDYGYWARSVNTPQEFRVLCVVGGIMTANFLIERKKELVQAQIELEKHQLKQAENQLDILQSWYKITRRQFKDNDEVTHEIKRYKDYVAQNNRDITLFKDSRDKATDLLNKQNKSLSNLRVKIEQLKKDRESFAQEIGIFSSCAKVMTEAEEQISEQVDITSKLIEIYSSGISILEAAKKETESIITELETKSIWQRSEYAVTWNGIKNIVPDISQFLEDLKTLGYTFMLRTDVSKLPTWLTTTITNPYALISFLFYLILFAMGLFLVRRYGARARDFFFGLESENNNILRLSRTIGVMLQFIVTHSLSVCSWAALFFAVQFGYITDVFLQIIFYLASIPFLMYCAHTLVNMIVQYNLQYDQVIFNATIQRRFSFVLTALCYVTIFIFFFREAFILATISKSELPIILFALYSILLRALVIFSIGKEEILSVIPSRGAFWNFVAQCVEHYYYLFLCLLIGLMIMSDPYVGGYSNLVSYLFWGVIGSMILFWVLYAVHDYVKNFASTIFFQSSDDDILRERFVNAKTWYGVLVIILFVCFVFIGLLIGARIWNIPFTIDSVIEFWDIELFSTGYDQDLAKTIWFTPKKLTHMLFVILCGFFIAFGLNRYVLENIFDLLPVSLGVQDTIQAISRYLILAMAVFLGFQWAGIESLLVYLGVILASIGWMAKEPLSDFVSYFVILVQRPIQIGDYIKVSDEMQGVVRQITPRSVLLRRKNSYTIIVPNSTIITHPVSNWSYAKNFTAIDDIEFTVPYSCDPAEVKTIVARVVDASINVLKSPAPIIRLHDFSQDGYVFLVRGFITDKHMLDRWDIASDIRFAIVKALRERGIQIAVPTRFMITPADMAQRTQDRNPIDGKLD